MNIKSEQASGPCDLCDKGTASVGALAQGATGRVCEVMWMCETCAGGKPELTAQEAREQVEVLFGEGAWAEF